MKWVRLPCLTVTQFIQKLPITERVGRRAVKELKREKSKKATM